MNTIFAKGGLTVGSADDDLIEGSDGFDAIFASSGNDVVNGGAGDDRLDGGAGNDVVNGGAGDDRLDGGTGNDVMFGGLGADTFVFRPFDPGLDVIGDFNVLEDKLQIDLPGDGSKFGLDASVLDFVYSGNDLIITLDGTSLHITMRDLGPTPDVPYNVSFI